MSLLDSANVSFSQVFSESSIKSGKPLKNPDSIREAFIVNELSHLSQKSLREFVNSPEAKYMVENDILSYDTLNTLANDVYGDRATEFCVCHMAKENDDPAWAELVRLREEERRVMNELIAKYGDDVAPHAKMYRENWVNKYVPKHFQTGESSK